MDETEIKHVLEAALLAAGRPLTLDRLAELFSVKGAAPDRVVLKRALESLATDYANRGIELKEVATGYRVQVRRSMTDWLQPLWEERAPRYTRALLETLALIAYRQPITRAEIEEVRGVVVSTNIMRTLLDRGWVRVVGHRDVPGKPAMFGTTKEFLDYFGLKKLEDLPTLAEIKDGLPELSPQADLVESLEEAARGVEAVPAEGADEVSAETSAAPERVEPLSESEALDTLQTGATGAEPEDDTELAGPDILIDEGADAIHRGGDVAPDISSDADEPDDERPDGETAEIIPLRARGRDGE